MTTPIHSRQTITEGIHSSVSFTYVTSASLVAATGFSSYDLYKLALVTGDNSVWILIDVGTPTWKAMGSLSGSVSSMTGSGGTSVSNTGGDYIVSSSITTLSGIAGTSVSLTPGSTNYVVSSSLGAPPEAFYILSASNSALINGNILSASGGSALSYAGGKAIVSSSIPLVQNLIGEGAVAVTPPVYPSTTWIISGSGGGGGGGSTYLQATGSLSVTGDGSLSTPYILSASVIQVSGSGGVSVATSLDASRFVISSSVTTVAGLGGSSVTLTPGSSEYVVSSSAPAIESLSGLGGVTVGNSGKAFTVSSSIATVSGLGGSSVSLTPGSTAYVVSSSIPVVEAISGVGAVSVSNSGKAFSVSASIVTVAGAGGSAVTTGGGTSYTVSSSIPAIESLGGAGGTSVSNSGKSFTVSSSIGAPLEASYITLNTSAALTAERVLTAGTGISFTDGGAGSTLTVNATGGSSTPNVYKVTASYVMDSRAATTDYYLLISASAHNITASLPAPTSGRVIVAKDLGSGSSFPWMIAPVSSAKIDTFSASYTAQATFGVLTFVSDGTDWFIV